MMRLSRPNVYFASAPAIFARSTSVAPSVSFTLAHFVGCTTVGCSRAVKCISIFTRDLHVVRNGSLLLPRPAWFDLEPTHSTPRARLSQHMQVRAAGRESRHSSSFFVNTIELHMLVMHETTLKFTHERRQSDLTPFSTPLSFFSNPHGLPIAQISHRFARPDSPLLCLAPRTFTQSRLSHLSHSHLASLGARSLGARSLSARSLGVPSVSTRPRPAGRTGHLATLSAGAAASAPAGSHPGLWPVSHGLQRGVLARHPALESSLHTLPKFHARASDVRVLYEPSAFYNALLAGIQTAKRRIFLASLYIGTGAHEEALVAALSAALAARPQLELVIVLDALRSTRERPAPSSASLVAALRARFPCQVRVYLFRTPHLDGWRRLLPKRFNEGFGLQHIKCYGFDDAVLLSGANLSHDYFTHRQDRYIHIANPLLADYFHELLLVIGRLSLEVNVEEGALPALGADVAADEQASGNDATPPPPQEFSPHPAFTLPEPRPPAELVALGKELLTELTERWTRASQHAPRDASDTTIQPVLQMGPFGIRHETELAMPLIFEIANSLATAPGGTCTTVDWTSGYFSISDDYLRRIKDCRARVRIVAASPEANSFFRSRGVSKYIPPAYTHLTKEFYDSLLEPIPTRTTVPDITIHEWKRDGWTYHAKGIWITPSFASLTPLKAESRATDDPLDSTPSSLDVFNGSTDNPILTLIGSSNFGMRSAERDLEATALIRTTNENLRQNLGYELENIQHFATDAVNDSLFSRRARKVPWGVKVAVRYIRSML